MEFATVRKSFGNGQWRKNRGWAVGVHKASPKSEELLSLGKEIARLEGENNALTDGIGLPVEIRETIKSLDAQIHSCDIEIKACNAVLQILENIQKESHLESAPELNKKYWSHT